MIRTSTSLRNAALMIVIQRLFLVLLGCFFGSIVYSQARITSITPNAAPVGGTIKISGTSFDTTGKYSVYIGGVRATIKSATSTTLTVTVPAGASDNFVTVTGYRFTSFSPKPLVISFPGGIKLSTQSLEPKVDLPAAGPVKTAAADFNNDGKADLVIANFQSKSVAVYKNNAKPGKLHTDDFELQLNLPFSGNPFNLATGDLNSDGKQDLAVISRGEGLFVYTNNSSNGQISFLPARKIYSGTRLYQVIIHDLDRNGKADLILSNDSTKAIQIIQNGSATDSSFPYGPVISLAAAEMVENISIADIDLDARPDIVANSKKNDTVTFFANKSGIGTISYALPVYNSAALLPGKVTTGDLDLDGKPDIILTNSSPFIYILRNATPGGTFNLAAKIQVPGGFDQYTSSVADIDGDGRQEVIIANQGPGTVSILKNSSTSGNIAFQGIYAFSGGIKPVDVLIADLDADGKQDVVVANDSLNTVSIFRNRIAEPKLLPSGASPVSGPVIQKLIIDSPVQVYNSQPYVQRHYDIEPEENPSTSTATVTLYFTQQEFNNYNNLEGPYLKLPIGESDSAGKSNLRVFQFHGTSASSTPGTYSGESIEIDPEDSNVVWNATEARWEVSIEVSGFSGFFVGSPSFSMLPYRLISFSGNLKQDKSILTWQTSDEFNVSHFELQRSSDPQGAFLTIGKIYASGAVSPNIYKFTDYPAAGFNYYYRLKTVDNDSSFSYSKLVAIGSMEHARPLNIYPNPGKGSVTVKHPVSNKGVIQLIDAAGRVIQSVHADNNKSETKLNISTYSPGIYRVRYIDGNMSLMQTLKIE